MPTNGNVGMHKQMNMCTQTVSAKSRQYNAYRKQCNKHKSNNYIHTAML